MNVHVTAGGTTADLTNGPAREFGPGRLRLVGQFGPDHAKLEQLCPSDQERTFRGRWTAPGVFEFEEVVETLEQPAPGEGGEPREPGGNPEADAAAAELALASARKAAVAAERKRLSNRSKGDLQERAAVVGVAWDDKASRDTMLDRIAEGVVAKAAADAAK